jgi:hypothetical protein
VYQVYFNSVILLNKSYKTSINTINHFITNPHDTHTPEIEELNSTGYHGKLVINIEVIHTYRYLYLTPYLLSLTLPTQLPITTYVSYSLLFPPHIPAMSTNSSQVGVALFPSL